MDNTCVVCGRLIQQDLTGEPYVWFKDKAICSSCAWDLIPRIYDLGYGGFVQFVFRDCLESGKNRKRRRSMRNYKKVFNMLLHKYKFRCAICGSIDNLTIDHIKPVKLGGTDDYSNLQILCRSCNSKKNIKYDSEL